MIFKSIICAACLAIISFNLNANTIVGPQTLIDGRTVDLQGLEWLSFDSAQANFLTRDQVEATILDGVSGGGWAYASVNQTTRLMTSLLGDGSTIDKIIGAEWFISAFGQTDDYVGPVSMFNYGRSDECGLNVSCVSGVSLSVNYGPYEVLSARICYIFGEGCGGPIGGEGPWPDDDTNGAGHLLIRAVPVLQFSGASYDIKENDGSVIVTVQRVNGSFGEVTVDYNTADGTAAASVDYQPVSGTLTFVAGETSQIIEIPLLDDMTYEGDESFAVELSNVQGGATLGSVTSAQVIIDENDPAPPSGVLQFSEATYSVDENAPSIIATVTRVNVSFGEISVDYNTADLIAVEGEDYQSTSGSLIFSDGVTSRIIEILLLDDMTYEGDESFAIELSNVQGGATLGGAASAQLVIREDDAVPPSGILKFSGASYSTNENNSSVIVTVQRDSGSFGEVSVNYNTADFTAVAGEDYQSTSGTLVFADGEISRIIEVTLLDDTTYEGDETFSVKLSNVLGGAVLGNVSSTQVVINEDDSVPPSGVLQFSGSNYSVDENGVSVVVAIMRVNGSFGEVSVDYNTADGTAVAGEDYQSVSGTLFFADGETSRAIAVTMLDDMVFEGNETFRVLLSNVKNGGVLGTPESSVITIKEDDVNTENDNDATDSSDTIKSSGGSSMGPLLLVFLLLGFIARTYAVAHYHRVSNSHTTYNH